MERVRNCNELGPGGWSVGGDRGHDETGAPYSAAVRTLIDDALLPQFCVAGTKVHLLRDPDDASILAVNRARTPLEIPPASG